MNTSEIKTYEQWNALSNEEKFEYFKNEIVSKVKFKDGYTNIERYEIGEKIWILSADACGWKYCFYRIKPEPKYVPYNRETFTPFADCWFRVLDSGVDYPIGGIKDDGVRIYNMVYTWEELLKHFLRIDLKTGETFPAGIEEQP